jgi:hypothetical protein
MINILNKHLNLDQMKFIQSLTSPIKIQAFLDIIPYSAENRDRSPIEVIQDRKAHCMDGALFAAAALRQLGYPPLIVDLLPEPGSDDDHMLAIYKYQGFFGAIAKSNYVGLRFREPIYRNLRELVMSYFEQYFNKFGQKTLRSYSLPVNMTKFDKLEWMTKSDNLPRIEKYFTTLKQIPIISPTMINRLAKVDPRSLNAGLFGSDLKGLYEPKI